MTHYTSVKVPMALSRQIQQILEPNGFTSVSDFVLYATRSTLREFSEKRLRNDK